MPEKKTTGVRDFAIVIMAAGKGTRLKSKRAKVLHEIGGQPLLAHVIKAAQQVVPAEHIHVIVGHQAESVRAAVAPMGIKFVLQAEQRGTGHADGHSGDGGRVEPLAAGEERFGAHHPKGRDGDDESGDAAGDEGFGNDERAVANAQREESAKAGPGEVFAFGQIESADTGEEQEDGAGKDEAYRDQHQWREGFERHADAEVGGAPENAHCDQGEVWLEERMLRQ